MMFSWNSTNRMSFLPKSIKHRSESCYSLINLNEWRISIRSLSLRSNEDLINHLERFLNTATIRASEPCNRTLNIFDSVEYFRLCWIFFSVSSRDHASSSLIYSNDDIPKFRKMFIRFIRWRIGSLKRRRIEAGNGQCSVNTRSRGGARQIDKKASFPATAVSLIIIERAR